MTASTILLTIYFALVLVHLCCILFGATKIQRATKPFLMPLLGVWAWVATGGTANWLLLAGIFFGFLGDTLLLFDKQQWSVIAGIGAFGVGHILYTILLASDRVMPGMVWRIAVPVALALVVLFIYNRLSPSLPKEMRIPVIFYIVVICAMSLAAIWRFLGAPGLATGLAAVGSVLFIVSDSVLAFQLFSKKTRIGGFVVMLTYLAAQTLIVFGVL